MTAALRELDATATPTECVALGDTECHSCGGGFVLCRNCWDELKSEIDNLYKV
jgi:hypothetical protein